MKALLGQKYQKYGAVVSLAFDFSTLDDSDSEFLNRIPTVKFKIPGKAFLKSESRTSVTFKL